MNTQQKSKSGIWWILACIPLILIVAFPLLFIFWSIIKFYWVNSSFTSIREPARRSNQSLVSSEAQKGLSTASNSLNGPAVDPTPLIGKPATIITLDGNRYEGTVVRTEQTSVSIFTKDGVNIDIPFNNLPAETALKYGCMPSLVKAYQDYKIDDERQYRARVLARTRQEEVERLLKENETRQHDQELERQKMEQLAQEQKIQEAQKEQLVEATKAKTRRQAERVALIRSLRKDLDSTVADLKAYFPKRTKVEDYNVIALTAVALAQSGDRTPLRELMERGTNPYGLTEGDILGIRAAYQRNLPPDTSGLESKIDDLTSQNAPLQDSASQSAGIYHIRSNDAGPATPAFPIGAADIKSGLITGPRYDVTDRDGVSHSGTVIGDSKFSITIPDGPGPNVMNINGVIITQP